MIIFDCLYFYDDKIYMFMFIICVLFVDEVYVNRKLFVYIIDFI